MSDARDVVRQLTNRIVALVNRYANDGNPATNAFVSWVRSNQYLDTLWHDRALTRAKVRVIVTNVVQDLLTYSENPQCPEPAVIKEVVTSDDALVSWCVKQGILEPPEGSWPLTVWS